MKHLKFLFRTLLLITVAVTSTTVFSSCKDDEDSSDNLANKVIGVWAQDCDNAIMALTNDGKGTWYGDADSYDKNEPYNTFTWYVNNEWLYFKNSYGDEEKMRPVSISKNKIEWKRYSSGLNANNSDGYDSFGFYEIWTWERYK